jgi:5'-nucleotidase
VQLQFLSRVQASRTGLTHRVLRSVLATGLFVGLSVSSASALLASSVALAGTPVTEHSTTSAHSEKTAVTKSTIMKTSPSQSAPPVHITLLQLNDVYQIAPVDGGKRGGLARVAALVKTIKAENPNTFLVLGGDTLSPSLASNMFQGAQMIAVWNSLGLDVAVLGNHEFDFGDDILITRIKESHFPWIAANVIDSKTGKSFNNLPPYLVKTVDDVQIGFLGLLTPDTVYSSHPGPTVTFQDPAQTACTMLGRMQREGVDVVVGLTHLPMNEDQRVARQQPLKLALILGGHEHTFLQSAAGGTPILKMGSDARTLGRVDLYVDADSHLLQNMDWQAIPITDTLPEDPDVADVVKSYESKIDSALGSVIGQSTVVLDARQETNRREETNLGDFIADAYRQNLDADVALMNGGGIRSNTTYAPGPLTRRDILSMMPFSNPSVKLSVSGAILKAALENGVSRLGAEEAGRFPQVSGLRFTYDGRKPAGSRVVSLTVDSKPVNPAQHYTMATTTFLQGGGDDYAMLKDAKVILSSEETPIDNDIVTKAVEAAKTISPKVDGRIQRLDKPL